MEQAYCTAVFWRGGEKIELESYKGADQIV